MYWTGTTSVREETLLFFGRKCFYAADRQQNWLGWSFDTTRLVQHIMSSFHNCARMSAIHVAACPRQRHSKSSHTHTHTHQMTSSTQSPTQNMLGHAWPSHRFYLHDASKGPNVGLCAMALPVEYLRGQVVGGSTDGSKRDTHTHTGDLLNHLHTFKSMPLPSRRGPGKTILTLWYSTATCQTGNETGLSALPSTATCKPV